MKAFTLIELLIVVAIIAILAAIAVPNFLEAQTRSKVSRNMADMRAFVTAIESYHIDQSKFPYPSDPFGRPETLPGATPWFETKAPNSLTTPISYLSTRYSDPYHPKEAKDEDPVYHLMTRFYATAQNSENQFNLYLKQAMRNESAVQYILLGHGPDGDHDGPDNGMANVTAYDATNGTTSNGDILFFGPGFGFGK